MLCVGIELSSGHLVMALDHALPSGTEASAPVILSAGKGPGARWHRPLLAVFFFFEPHSCLLLLPDDTAHRLGPRKGCRGLTSP